MNGFGLNFVFEPSSVNNCIAAIMTKEQMELNGRNSNMARSELNLPIGLCPGLLLNGKPFRYDYIYEGRNGKTAYFKCFGKLSERCSQECSARLELSEGNWTNQRNGKVVVKLKKDHS